MATRKAIILGINSLKIAFPNYNPDAEGTAILWERLLVDVEDATLETAVLVCLTDRRAFAPSIGEIRAAAIDLHIKAAGIPSALEAYAEVMDKPKQGPRIGDLQELDDGTWGYPRGPVGWSHSLVESVAWQMGWPSTFPTDNPGVDRGQFRVAYEAALSQMSVDGGRLPIVAAYIESKRPQLSGSAPALSAMNKAVKRLEKT